MIVTWPVAVGVVCSVGTICLTILKIIQMRKPTVEESPVTKCEKLQDRLAEVEKKLAVLQAHMEECRRDREEFGEHLEKVNDLLIKILTDQRD